MEHPDPMLSTIRHSDPRTRLNLAFLLIFLIVALFFGGASRADVLSQPVVRLAAVALISIALGQMTVEGWRQVRVPASFLLAMAAIILVQLIPLPPAIWNSLPGRDLYREAIGAVGLPPAWRPISLTPDLTLNALLAILPPLAITLSLGTIDRSLHRVLVPLLLVGIVVSALIGILQISGGLPYFYDITNQGSAVGIFSNRNHQSAFIALSFPLLACWTELPHPDPAYRRLRVWLASCMAASVFPILLVTGSRAGLIIGVIAAVLAVLLPLGRRKSSRSGRIPGLQRFLPLIALAVGILSVAAIWFFARDTALRRLVEGDQNELRLGLLPVFVQMIRDFMPFGSGFGSLDTVFRAYEPHQALQLTYLNHAHNDLAELLIEAGVAAALLLLAFLAWFLRQLWRLWTQAPERTGDLIGRTGTAIALLLLLASVVDYPLRTPFLATVMAIACLWMVPPPRLPKVV
jgi:O-antigen ligase